MSNRTRIRHYRNGLRAEIAAAFYLLLRGYLPVAWRYKTPVGEIDLIVRRGHTLVFVEVKARANHTAAAEALHARNQARVVRAAQYYLGSHPNAANYTIRFDAVLIAWYRWPHHLIHAFS